MALRAFAAARSVVKVVPQISVMGSKGFASFDDRERGEEVRHANNSQVLKANQSDPPRLYQLPQRCHTATAQGS